MPYTWDNNGNLTNDGSKTYTYDQANRLTGVSATGLTWSATYNGDGARLRQIVNAEPTTYTLDLAAPLVQVLVQEEAGGKTAYLYGVTRVGEQQPAGWVYHLSDALGSVRQLVDSGAQVVLARGYMPYGEALWSVGSDSSVYGFTGEAFDPSVALVFLRARYMQPRLGMFLSHDPWEGDVLRPGSMNGWNYAEGNSTNRIDPSGRFSAVALAKTYGFSGDADGIAKWLSSMAPYWGWASLLLDAKEEDSVVNWSTLEPVQYGTFTCKDGKVGLDIDYNRNRAIASDWSALPRPGPGLWRWWRKNGVYWLINNSTAPVGYADKGDSGYMTDLPDYRIVAGASAGAGAGGVSPAVLQDRYGNWYLSPGVTWGVPGVYLYLGEGYIGTGNVFNGFGGLITSESQLKQAMSGAYVSLSGAIFIGGQVNINHCGTIFDHLFGSCYASIVYTSGSGWSLGVSGAAGVEIPDILTSQDRGWDWMLWTRGPTKQEVWSRAMESLRQNPCGECSSH